MTIRRDLLDESEMVENVSEEDFVATADDDDAESAVDRTEEVSNEIVEAPILEADSGLKSTEITVNSELSAGPDERNASSSVRVESEGAVADPDESEKIESASEVDIIASAEEIDVQSAVDEADEGAEVDTEITQESSLEATEFVVSPVESEGQIECNILSSEHVESEYAMKDLD